MKGKFLAIATTCHREHLSHHIRVFKGIGSEPGKGRLQQKMLCKCDPWGIAYATNTGALQEMRY
jgi:hypothetical protein